MEPDSQQPDNRHEVNEPASKDVVSGATSVDVGPHVVIKKRTIYQRGLSFTLSLLLIFLALVFCALIFTQLPVFNRLIVHELVKTVETSTNGTLVIGDVQGNLLTGFVMNDVSLRLKTGTKYDSIPILHADHILAKYSLIRWLRTSEIGVVSMVIQHPIIRLVKFTGDTVWNYKLLFKPVPTAPKGPPQPFTQIVDLQSFRIQGGTLTMRDYNYPARPTKIVAGIAQVQEQDIDWHDVDVEGLDLDSRLYAKGGAAQSIKVSHLRFAEKKSGFFVQHLEFSGYADSLQARMDQAKITTGHSDLNFDLELAPPSIAKTGLFSSLEHSSMYLVLNGPTISTYELKQFLPGSLGFLNGSPAIALTTHGEFGHLHIDHLGLNFKGRGTIAIAGDLNNLHDPKNLGMDLTLNAEGISNSTLNGYVPGLHITDLSRLGTVNIPSLHYIGEPLNFRTIFTARSTGAGDASGDVTLDLRNHGFVYKAGLKAARLNLASIIKNPTWQSNLNADIQAQGSGTNWRTMSSKVNLKTTAPSVFGKYDFTNLDLAGVYNKGIATVSHLDGALVGGPVAHVQSAMVNFLSPQFLYRFKGTVNDIRIGQFVKNYATNPAKVDVNADIAGAGKNFEEVSGTIHARLYDLVFQGHHFQDVNAVAVLAPTRAGTNKLSVQSDIADISIERRFRLGDLVSTVPEHINALVTAIKDRYFPTDTLHTIAITNCSDSIDFDYYVHLKDLRPLAGFVPNTFLLAQGAISGSVYGCPRGDISMILEADSLGVIMRERTALGSDSLHAPPSIVLDSTERILRDSLNTFNRAQNIDTIPPLVSSPAIADSLRLADSSAKADSSLLPRIALPDFGTGVPRIHLTPATFRIEAHNISNDPHKVLDHLDATVDFIADSVIRLGSALLYHPKFGLVYRDRVLNYDLATVYNDILGFRLKGNATFPTGEFDFAIDTLRLAYFNRAPGAQVQRYSWFNEGPSHVRITESGLVTIDTLTLLHPMARGLDPHNAFVQRFSLGGWVKGDSLGVWADVPRFDLHDLPKLIPLNPNSKTLRLSEFAGTVRQMHVTLGGTMERPDMSARLAVDRLEYGGLSFDTSYADLSYKDLTLRGNVLLHVDTISAPFTSTETQLPFNLVLSAANEFQLRIDSIPLLIALKRGPTYSADSAALMVRPLSAQINASHFPIDVATPFIPAFSELHGLGDIHFAVSGTRAHIAYGGFATVKDGNFLLAANNMYYLFDGTVAFKDNALTLNDIGVHNVPADDPRGEAVVNGHFDFQGFSIKSFDLALHSDRLAVLSEESRQAIHSFYGPLTISTGGSDIHFHNTLQAPWLEGHIAVLNSNLTLPQTQNGMQQVNTDGIIYRFVPSDSMQQAAARLKDTTHVHSARDILAYTVNEGSVQTSTIDDSLFSNRMKNIYLDENGNPVDTSATSLTTENGSTQLSFADRLRMKLEINVQGNAWVNMPFNGVFGIIGVQLNAELQSDGSIFVDRGDDLVTHVTGDLSLTPNSTFKFYQTFQITQGRISFRDNFNNPEINVVAEYVGTHHTASGSDEQVKLQLSLTGTKSQPKLTASIYTEDPGGNFNLKPETSTEATEDIVTYLITGGSFRSDLATESDQMAVISQAANTFGSQFLNNMLSSFLGSSSSAFSIRSAALRFGGAGAGLQLTAAYRNVTIKFNSGTFNDPLRADYEIIVPFNALSSSFGRTGRNLLFDMQIHTNSQTLTSAGALIDQPTVLGKLTYRIPF